MSIKWKTVVLTSLALVSCLAYAMAQQAEKADAPHSALVMPLARTAYFVGEKIPMAVTGAGDVKVEMINSGGRLQIYQGKSGTILLDTSLIAPGDYSIEINGVKALERLTITSPLRRSCASMQDEAEPNPPQRDPQKQKPEEYSKTVDDYWEYVAGAIKESGLTSVFALAQSDAGRFGYLDALARGGAIVMANCDTRPTSFNPGTMMPQELDGMSQRMILAAQANARHPNFAGFCFAWDTTGHAIGGRRQLLVYWGWADKGEALRSYIDRVDRFKEEEFIRRSGLEPVSEKDYLAYLLRTGQAELAPTVDLPIHVWIKEMAKAAKPMPEAERAAFERRLDAWAAYMMGMYGEVYGNYVKNLSQVDPALKYTGSVQIDHNSTRCGQYLPAAYAPLSFRYQSTWNDQVGGPDYLFQWLITQGLLDMERGTKPTWISNAVAMAHHRAEYPGKFTRVAAHGLAYGGSGIGFACEAFSNLLGGMNAGSNWSAIKGKNGGADVLAGKDFLDRFAGVALSGAARNGVGILFSKTQYGRQNVTPAFGSAPFTAFTALARLGYTPCFLTEDDVLAGRTRGVKAIVLLGQTVLLPKPVQEKIEAFAAGGGLLVADGNSTVKIAGMKPFAYKFELSPPGKPHNWSVPNMPAGDNDVTLINAWQKEFAPVIDAALGGAGRAILAPAKGTASDISVFEISGGADASYIVAVNDSNIATQADWYQVKEQLVPATGTAGTLYDCTAEKMIGPVAPVECDLSASTAKVYAVLKRPLKSAALSASQKITDGENLVVAVEFRDDADKRLAAVIPFNIAISRPDGSVYQEFYRNTKGDGLFSMSIPVPANVPAGKWTVSLRSQLDGSVSSLPVEISAAKTGPAATAVDAPVIMRESSAIDAALAKGASFVIPVFDSPQAEALAAAAEKVKAELANRGVSAEIWSKPSTATYTLGYATSAFQEYENSRIDRGEAIGMIKRETVNANDWFSALSGWRFGKPVILIDLVNPSADTKALPANPMARSLQNAGLLWPEVSAEFPGRGRAVVQLVHWAFAPRVPAIVIQAADPEGLAAGAAALAKPQDDFLTPGIRNVKAAIWREFHVGEAPAMPEAKGLTSKDLKVTAGPKPFAIDFPGDVRPPTPDQVKRPERPVPPAISIPATFLPKDYTVFYLVGDNWTESATAEPLVPDLRFSQGVRLVLDIKNPGKTKIIAKGVFRYSDRQPCTQAQWEDYLSLRRQLVPARKEPMSMDILLDGKTIGKLEPSKKEERKVMTVFTPMPSQFAMEEVVTELSGEVELPAGRQEIMLVEKNIVDGKLEMVGVGMDPQPPPPPEKK